MEFRPFLHDPSIHPKDTIPTYARESGAAIGYHLERYRAEGPGQQRPPRGWLAVQRHGTSCITRGCLSSARVKEGSPHTHGSSQPLPRLDWFETAPFSLVPVLPVCRVVVAAAASAWQGGGSGRSICSARQPLFVEVVRRPRTSVSDCVYVRCTRTLQREKLHLCSMYRCSRLCRRQARGRQVPQRPVRNNSV